jgi:threonine synthase
MNIFFNGELIFLEHSLACDVSSRPIFLDDKKNKHVIFKAFQSEAHDEFKHKWNHNMRNNDIKYFKCLMCNHTIKSDQIRRHKQKAPNGLKYAILWPNYNPFIDYCYDIDIPIYHSTVLSKALGVRKVYILDEGCNISGSMKDYLVKKTIQLAEKKNISIFNIASSGNHALSLANQTQMHGYSSLIFVPASSFKIKHLSTFDNTLVIALKDATYEDVYRLSNQINVSEIFNANVSNELLITGFQPVARQICALSPLPSHILAGVGNGTYLSGLAWSFQHTLAKLPKIVPVGMKGAFPFENAVNENINIYKYRMLGENKKQIDEAPGSIALESYNMPQLFHALKLSDGFPLGGLKNSDLRNAYSLLMNDETLMRNCVIPEPTGIMGLAAAIKHKQKFSGDDILLISFTGHAFTSIDSVKRLVPEMKQYLNLKLPYKKNKLFKMDSKICQNIIYMHKNIRHEDLNRIIQNWINTI